jgi:sialate O-acetylesterase
MKPLRLLLLLCASLPLAHAELHLPRIFGDHMVLQAGLPVPVWGWADAGETVTVRFAGQEKSATADTDGRWSVQLDALAVSAQPAELTVAAHESRVLTDVLVGEVWLCSGQSNMEKPLGEQHGQKPVLNAEEEIRAADFPLIRLFKVTKARASAPARDLQGEWTACRPDTIDRIKFSAAGYFFGRKLHQELGGPVGLIDSTWGGTRIEVWTPPAGFAAVPALADFTAALQTPGKKAHGAEPAALCNAMILPLVPFALRGALWYQGESNIMDVDDGALYADKMKALVRGWRALWAREFSFYFVQVAPHLYHVVRPAQVVSPEATPRVWEAQAAAQRQLPHTGMVVTTDLVDDLMDIHPRNKKDVGERLARWALVNDYGRTGIEVSGPVFQRMEIAGGRAVLHFDHLGGGLVAADKKTLTWFVIAGADGKFFPGRATIDGDTVVVSSASVPAPAVVRFAWDEAARPNLANQAGLPASPFRTDDPFTAKP